MQKKRKRRIENKRIRKGESEGFKFWRCASERAAFYTRRGIYLCIRVLCAEPSLRTSQLLKSCEPVAFCCSETRWLRVARFPSSQRLGSTPRDATFFVHSAFCFFSSSNLSPFCSSLVPSPSTTAVPFCFSLLLLLLLLDIAKKTMKCGGCSMSFGGLAYWHYYSSS